MLAIADLVDFEDYGSLHLTRIDWEEGSITLWLNVSADECPDIHPRWQVVCPGVREECLSLGCSYDIQLSGDHVLLWPHAARRTSTSFYGKRDNPSAVIGALYERHCELAGKWIPFHRFLNADMRLTELIGGGFGMLAEGPEPLILAYEEVMQRYGFLTSHLDPRKPVYWDGQWIETTTALAVLILGESYVVAERFEAKSI
ncbi:MAG: hypothetical protein ACRD68_00980 [Pyrinomonadaceae bacterium]